MTAAAAIVDGVTLLARHGGIVEARILQTPKGTLSGYFDDFDALAKAVAPWDGAASIYVTANPVMPDLLARSVNRVKPFAKVTTTDAQIARRAWFLLDFDPVRPKEISSTNAELALALARRDDAVGFLVDLGFPPPVLAMSGNGGHALWAVDEPNDEPTMVLFKRALKALGTRFTDGAVILDESVFNASRIWKAYGTTAVKGDSTAARPHRRAEVECAPDPLVLVARGLLETLAAQAADERPTGHAPGNGTHRETFDLVGAFTARGLYRKPLDGGKHAVTCPWASAHSGDSGVTETCVFEPRAAGEPWGFKCMHATCSARTIRDVITFLGLGASQTAPPSERVTAPPAAAAPTRPWPTLDRAALIGLAGRCVEVIAPQSEADPVAILLHFLAATGNLIGPGPHARVEQDQHPARLNVVLVGKSSKGRKGTSWSTPRAMLRAVDPDWAIAAGLSSGEGLIYHVRDRVTRENTKTGETEVVDEGITDKRLLVLETEFASVFGRMDRDGNTLSPVMRDAWDHGDLRTLTKNSPLKATGAHISVVGHITAEELGRLFTDVSMANGWGNRILWALVRRAKLLPDGGGVDARQYERLVDDVQRAVAGVGAIGGMSRDPEAAVAWRAVYPDLSRERDGLVGALLGRAEAQTLRLSVLYAALDGSHVIRLPHLQAALAVWSYCEASVLDLFGGRTGDAVADVILDALRKNGRLTMTQIHDLFGRNKSADKIRPALGLLERANLARLVKRETGGRPEEAWEAVWTT